MFKRLLTGIVILVLSNIHFANAQSRLAIIESDSNALYCTIRDSALATLTTGGMKEGIDYITQKWSIGNDIKKGEEAVKEAAKWDPDVIFVAGTIAATAAKTVSLNDSKLKFVYAGVTDAVGVGLIREVGQTPNANFTGVSFPVPVNARLKFVKNLIPSVKTIGLIYADMPQSLSYKKWLEDALTEPEFSDLKIIFKSVPLITGNDGARKMAEAAQKIAKEMNSSVDVFLSPNDQMGVNAAFPEAIASVAQKPLIGLGEADVMKELGATAAIFPSFKSIGAQAGVMIFKILKGSSVKTITPEWVKDAGVALDMKRCKQFKITPPISILKLAGKNVVK